MTPASRPLRALGLVLGGWTTMRVVALWPGATATETPLSDAAPTPLAPPVAVAPFDARLPFYPERHAATDRAIKIPTPVPEQLSGSVAKQEPYVRRAELVLKQAQHESQAPDVGDRSNVAPESQGFASIAPGLPTASSNNRFSGSAWALMRGDGAASLASGGQLGGSQVGMRLFYTPGPEAVAVTARISAPLSSRTGREAAVGLALRSGNVGVIAEQRFALDRGGRDAPAVIAYGGVYDIGLPGGVKLDGYAQAGVVGAKSPAAFVDGAIRVERTVLRDGKASLSVGAGAWGGAQPGAARIDLGPQVVARVAVAETNLRVSPNGGSASPAMRPPASGPSVTVGIDF